MPIVTHAAYSVIEFYEILAEHRMTPIELLESLGLLGPDLTIGHGNLVAENPRLPYSGGGHDVEIMGRHGVTVSHCPVNIARRARTLDSWARYRAAGVNLALGTDTYPARPDHADAHGVLFRQGDEPRSVRRLCRRGVRSSHARRRPRARARRPRAARARRLRRHHRDRSHGRRHAPLWPRARSREEPGRVRHRRRRGDRQSWTASSACATA
jgi:hypothetical protein